MNPQRVIQDRRQEQLKMIYSILDHMSKEERKKIILEIIYQYKLKEG